jgi:acyl transferase domain-containing protein/surfactin synthase thioesterase subunit/acyl carrier protein
VAVHLACESLHRGESSLALAGGVNLLLMPHGFLSLCSLHALSSDGRCKTFDASGDGYGRGEGCGIVVLKRLSDALRDKDPILAVIKATAVNQDGPSSGLTVPNGKAQKALILRALEAANVSPADIGYVELHGTGTALGDPIEFQALTEVFGKDNKREQPLYIGSVKSNIGHLEAAAGIASLIKSVLCLQNKQIPPNLHLHTINPKIRLEKIPAVVPQKVVPWETHGTPRMLGISVFGFSGTNAHAIVSEWEGTPLASSSFERPWHILALSAKDEKALSQAVARYGKHLEQNNGEKLEDICFTANVGRVHFPHRIAFLAEDREQLKKSLAAMYLRGNKGESVIEGKGQDHTHPKLAFLLSGKIQQELAQSLFETQPMFQQTIRTCDERLQQLAHLSLLEKSTAGVRIPNGNTAGLLDDVLAFALHLSLLKVWETWGIRPNAILGSHSGALVAACAAGVMDVETALGFLLEHCGVMGKAASRKVLKDPQIRLISGRTGQLVEKQEALSHRYWEQVLSGGLNRKKGMESLYILGYTHFLQTGIIDDTEDQEDLLDNSHAQYFPSLTESDPWRTLTTTLAHLYCLGLDIDWSGFEQGYSRRKVLLPTYPFQRNYFWCETTTGRLVSQGKTENRVEEKPAASSLDGRITNSPIKTKLVEYCLSLDAVPDVKDTHGVLHVGYFLEMLRRAVKSIYQTTAFRVQTINFLTAVMIPESGAVTLSLTLNAKESDELDFAFFSHQGDENWHKHTQGTILLDNTDSSGSIGADLKAEIISRCTDQYSGAEFYQKVQERGLFLGESVQWIEQVWARSGEVLARFVLPRSLETSPEYAMGVHPGVFEACAQLFHAALSDHTDTDMRYMVSRWENFVCHNRSLDQAFWCHVVLQDGSQTGGQLKGSFHLFDENGTVRAQIGSGVMKGLNKEREDALRNYLEASETTKERKSDSQIIRTLSGLSQDQWRDCLNAYLQQVFASILHVEVKDLSRDEALLDMGMDSIVGMEAKTQIEEELGIFLPIELLIVGPSIRELAESILPLLTIKSSQMEREIRDIPVPAYKMDIDKWIIRRKSNPQARVRLFCFPYGMSGGASLYRGWQARLPASVEVCPVQLPGKENRVKEKAFTDIGRATEVLKEVLAPLLDRPYAIYGHSSGAFLAYRLAYKLWSEMDNKPRHLFVGAYSSPTILPNPVVSLVREKLKERGHDDIPDPKSLSPSTPETMEVMLAVTDAILSANPELQSAPAASPELLRLFLPTGLAELRMIRDYNSVDTLLFDVPITAIHGAMDGNVTPSEMHAWQELTQGPFTFHTLPGGHLFLHEDQDQKQLLELISHDLEKYT